MSPARDDHPAGDQGTTRQPEHTVSALRATKRGRIALHVDGEFVCTVGEALVARHHLFAGKQLSTDELARLRDEAAGDKAVADAYRLLGQRARSRQELSRRLTEKGYDSPLVAAVIDRLSADGLLDDAAFARAFVADKRRLTGWGDQRIRRELAAFGVAAEVVSAALGPPDADDELARATAVLRKHGPPRGEREAARRRAFALLQRRGFSISTSYRALSLWMSGGAGDAESAGAAAGENGAEVGDAGVDPGGA